MNEGPAVIDIPLDTVDINVPVGVLVSGGTEVIGEVLDTVASDSDDVPDEETD